MRVQELGRDRCSFRLNWTEFLLAKSALVYQINYLPSQCCGGGSCDLWRITCLFCSYVWLQISRLLSQHSSAYIYTFRGECHKPTVQYHTRGSTDLLWTDGDTQPNEPLNHNRTSNTVHRATRLQCDKWESDGRWWVDGRLMMSSRDSREAISSVLMMNFSIECEQLVTIFKELHDTC